MTNGGHTEVCGFGLRARGQSPCFLHGALRPPHRPHLNLIGQVSSNCFTLVTQWDPATPSLVLSEVSAAEPYGELAGAAGLKMTGFSAACFALHADGQFLFPCVPSALSPCSSAGREKSE